jgi:hypothetical protein
MPYIVHCLLGIEWYKAMFEFLINGRGSWLLMVLFFKKNSRFSINFNAEIQDIQLFCEVTWKCVLLLVTIMISICYYIV